MRKVIRVHLFYLISFLLTWLFPDSFFLDYKSLHATENPKPSDSCTYGKKWYNHYCLLPENWGDIDIFNFWSWWSLVRQRVERVHGEGKSSQTGWQDAVIAIPVRWRALLVCYPCPWSWSVIGMQWYWWFLCATICMQPRCYNIKTVLRLYIRLLNSHTI